MTLKPGEIEAALIDDVCSRVRERLVDDQTPRVEQFVRQYYRWVPPEDLVGRSELDVYGAALAHWSFIGRRGARRCEGARLNPRFEQHGWQSRHTVVEIVTDDVPFVVDSVSMECSRHPYGIHHVIHPVIRVLRDDDGELVEVLKARLPAPREDVARPSLAESVIHMDVHDRFIRSVEQSGKARPRAGEAAGRRRDR
jgi:glutamate dehydrogenase